MEKMHTVRRIVPIMKLWGADSQELRVVNINKPIIENDASLFQRGKLATARMEDDTNVIQNNKFNVLVSCHEVRQILVNKQARDVRNDSCCHVLTTISGS